MTLNSDIQVFDSSLFTFNKGTQSLIAEVSTLQLKKFSTLFNDACDIGIGIKSAITGNVEYFYLSDRIEDDGDILSWKLSPLNKNLNCSVTLFND